MTRIINNCWGGTEVSSLKQTGKASGIFFPNNPCLGHFLAELSHTHLLGSVRLYVDFWTGVSNPRYFKTWMSTLFELLFTFLPPSFLLTLPSFSSSITSYLLTSTLHFTPSSFLFRCYVLPSSSPCSPPTQQT